GYSASAISSSLTSGPYESAVSMKLTSSSTARRRTDNALLRSFGGPQMPSPVRRIAPKPRRCTEICPPSETSPAKLADSSFLIMIASNIFFQPDYTLALMLQPFDCRNPEDSLSLY